MLLNFILQKPQRQRDWTFKIQEFSKDTGSFFLSINRITILLDEADEVSNRYYIY